MSRRFAVWSRVALVILVPLAVYNAWDYIETRRYDARLAAFRAQDEPRWKDAQATGDAERYYRAASALVSPDLFAGVRVDVRTQAGKALREGRWSPEIIDVFRASVARNRESLSFVDRAAALTFGGFRPGTSYNYRVGDLWLLSRLCEMRAAVAATDGDADGSLASFVSEARIVRALDRTAVPGSLTPTFSGLSAVMQTTTPSAAARGVAERAFADIDDDDRLRHLLLQMQAYQSSSSAQPTWFYAPHPLAARALVNSLDGLTALLVAAGQPWPQRIDAMNAVGLWPVSPWRQSPLLRSTPDWAQRMLNEFTKVTAEQIRRIRCARLLLSTTPLTLVDPFTGNPLRVGSCRL